MCGIIRFSPIKLYYHIKESADTTLFDLSILYHNKDELFHCCWNIPVLIDLKPSNDKYKKTIFHSQRQSPISHQLDKARLKS